VDGKWIMIKWKKILGIRIHTFVQSVVENSKHRTSSFMIRLSDQFYERGDCFYSEDGSRYKIIKVYKYNWYRKFLFKVFGIPFKLKNHYKVLKMIR
jgi:hypothetical protein